MPRRTYTSGDIHIGSDDIVPQSVQCRYVFCRTALGRPICHTCEQVHTSYGMAAYPCHFCDRFSVNIIFCPLPPIRFSVTALFEQKMGKVKIVFPAGFPIEFYECQFNLRVSRNPVSFSRAENRKQVIGKLFCDIQEFSFSGCVFICNCRLNQMTTAVHFVFVHIRPFFPRFFQQIICVKIPVGALCCCNYSYD